MSDITLVPPPYAKYPDGFITPTAKLHTLIRRGVAQTLRHAADRLEQEGDCDITFALAKDGLRLMAWLEIVDELAQPQEAE